MGRAALPWLRDQPGHEGLVLPVDGVPRRTPGFATPFEGHPSRSARVGAFEGEDAALTTKGSR